MSLIRMRVPRYMLDLITSYFSRRRFLYESDNDTERYRATAALWNIKYDDVLNLPMSSGVAIVGFAAPRSS